MSFKIWLNPVKTGAIIDTILYKVAIYILYILPCDDSPLPIEDCLRVVVVQPIVWTHGLVAQILFRQVNHQVHFKVPSLAT